MEYVVGIDIGGTFTDSVVVDTEGKIALGKAFSTPPDFSQGIIDALKVAAQELDLTIAQLLESTRLFLHSTTVAENAVVDGTLAKVGLITTAGFETTLFATRGGYGRWSGLTEDEKRNPIETDKLPPLIPTSRVKGLRERIDGRGKVLVKPEVIEIETAVKGLLEQDVESLGVSLLWSFVNDENEKAVEKVIRRLRPDIFLTLSHQIAPIVGEYERTSTVVLNSGLGPVVGKYLENLLSKIEEEGFKGILLVMQAHGGLLPVEAASKCPVGMIESGPVSGLVGSKYLGEVLGLKNIIAADMGGTTFKVGVVREGMIEYQRESMVLRYHYALPKMDVVSLGLAGGSIISVNPRSGVPQIGPQSAGSYPGPVCYDHGGKEPTICDVDAILGYLNPEFFVGGRADLNIDKATQVFKQKVADPLGMPTLEAAAAMYRLGNSMIYDLLHKVTIQRGLDPREFALFSFGGSAGMHVAAYGDELEVGKIVIPHSASVHGAFGLITSDIVHVDQTTAPMKEPWDLNRINEIFKDLQSRLVEQLHQEGFADDEIELQNSIDMRYRRQVHILTTPLRANGPISPEALEKTIQLFEALYEERYGEGSAYREAGIEMVTYRVRGAGLVKTPEFRVQDLGSKDSSHAIVETRKVWVHKEGEFQDVKGYDFGLLIPGNEILGPAVIWTPITTVVLNPDQVAQVDEYKNLLITRS